MTTKEKILAAVARIFFESGFEAITIKKVAEAAGIGKSTVYEYFDSKDKMIAEAVLYASNQFLDQFHQSVWGLEGLSFEESVKLSIEKLILAFKSEIGRFIRLMEEGRNVGYGTHLKNDCKDELMKLHEKAINYTKNLLDKGQVEHVIRKDLVNLDTVNFQRMLLVMCAAFTEETPIVAKYAKEVENPKEYIYDSIMRIYGA